MTALSSGLRKQLESSVLAARRAAEGASRAAVEGLGVFVDRRPEHLNAEQAALRIGLRAKWRHFDNDRQLLIIECAYEQWHRLLFARFLAENGLLLHPQYKAPVTLAECEELAAELGEPDGWAVAARFAAEILPGIFRLDDPCARVRLAPEGRYALEETLAGLPAEVFVADDSLGWVYQFWQKDTKDEVNASGRKIGGADLGPVTQLFTENYMVRFLLENSLGAWWAARHPDSAMVKAFEYLRFGDDGSPAAGSFEGWPERVAEVTVMDPCCGSGHFLVEAFSMLWQMRAEEEGLRAVEAQDAVLRENLFGLELDARCVQIAMFAVALQAWKSGGGWRQLPVPNIACSGIPVRAPVDEWKALAGGDKRLENALVRLHILFRDADTLGSLIDPKRATEITDPSGLQTSMEDVEWAEVAPLLKRAASSERGDLAANVLGADADGLVRAADFLSRRYVLQATNVPYLARRNQSPTLIDYSAARYSAAAPNLGTTCIARMCELSERGGAIAAVSPQNWLFQVSYQQFRRDLFRRYEFAWVARLGPGAFETITGEVVNVHLSIFHASPPASDHTLATLDLTSVLSARAKETALPHVPFSRLRQGSILGQSSARFTEGAEGQELLGRFVQARQGDATGDDPRFKRAFWEIPRIDGGWERLQSSPTGVAAYSGCEGVIDMGSINRGLAPGSLIRARDVFGKRGVVVRQTRPHFASLHLGSWFDMSAPVLFPRQSDSLAAVWAFARSTEFPRLVAELDPDRKVPNATFEEVPFEVERWRTVAEESGPLPERWSDDPTQWLFEGRPEVATEPLQVAVARLVGFRWPEQPESDELDIFADADGIVCVPSVGEAPAADRVQQLLAAAYGDQWSPSVVARLLAEAGSKKKSLSEWLRDEFFKQHCAVFQNRPFVWHVWDGLRDGFSAFVNYHRLDCKTLEKLTYTYLGTEWVERQRAEVRDEVAGAEARLVAALELQRKLELVLEGDPPFDIYVRWKSVAEQPIGWNPDLNDGVRLNIRPFVEAGVLRSTFNIHWRKDRGTNPDGSERQNDIHLTLADKTKARGGRSRT